MSSEFPKVPLGDLTINYDAKRRPVKASDRKAGPYPYYGASGIVDYVDGYLFDGEYLLVGEDGENMRTRQTPIAFLAKGKFWVNNHAHIVRGDCSASTKYLKYALAVTDISAYLTGAVMPKLTQGNLNKIPIPCPALEVQKRIVRLLGSLDDSIDSLQHQNATLESIAQRLFRSWFVNFDPVHAKAAGQEPEAMSAELAALFPSEFAESALGLIPKGWSLESLDASITYLNGLALQKYPAIDGEATLPVLKIAQLKAGRTDASILANRKMRPEFIVRDGDIVFSWSGSLEVKLWTGGEAALNQHLFKVFSAKNPAWFCYQGTLQHLPVFREIAASKATTMGHIQRHHLNEAKVAIAPKDLMNKCSGIFGPMHSLIVTNGKLIRELEELRDHLLPRLISGKLSLADAEAALAAVKPEVEQA